MKRSDLYCGALFVMLSAGTACRQEPAPEPEPTPEPAPAAPAPPIQQPVAAPSAEPPAQAAADEPPLPVIEDFEAEVEQSITVENYKMELAALEKELAP